jgi:hypothetical protein
MQPVPEVEMLAVSLYVYAGKKERTSAGDGLSILLVLDITAGKDTRHAGVAGAGLGLDVAVLVELDLALDQLGGGVVADGVEEPLGIDDLLLAGLGVLDAQMGHQAHGLVLAEDLGGDSVEAHGDLGVGQEAVGHGLAGAQFVAAHKHGDAAAVLGEEHGLLRGGVAAADDIERLIAEDGHGAVADRAGADSVLPELVLAGEVEAAGVGAGSEDDGVGGARGPVVGPVVPLRPHLERALRQVQLRDRLRDDLRAEPRRLCAHLVHQLAPADAIGEPREVLDVRGCGQLPARGGAVGQHSLIQDGLELRSREVDCGRVCAGAGADD